MGLSLDDVLRLTSGRLVNGDAIRTTLKTESIRVESLGPVAGSSSKHLAFFFSRRFERDLVSCAAGVLITGEAFVIPLEKANLPLWRQSAIVACRDPYFAMAVLSREFAGRISAEVPVSSGIHSTAVISTSAKIGNQVTIGAYTVVGENVRVGDGAVIDAHCFIGNDTSIGKRTRLFSGVRVYGGTEIGAGVRIHSGVVIGADGFGYAPQKSQDGQVMSQQKIWHVGAVIIEDDVEIGAGTCIDRGTIGNTTIGKGAKIDNLVQIGHNCQVGEGAIICGTVGLAGSSIIGRFATVGGGTGVGNQIIIGDRAMVGGMSGVNKNVEPGAQVVGNPHRDVRVHLKVQAMLNKMVGGRFGKHGST